MHIITESNPLHPPTAPFGSHCFRQHQILRRSDFKIIISSANQADTAASPLHQSRIIGCDYACSGGLFMRFRAFYGKTLEKFLHHPFLVLVACVMFVFSGITAYVVFGKGVAFFPRHIGGTHVALSRWDRESNSIAYSSDGYHWDDYVTFHVPLTPETRNLIGPAELAQMHAGAVIVNTSRGGIIDEAALFDALSSGRIGGAGIDVFEAEPPPADHPLFALPNIVLAPHVAGVTEGSMKGMAFAVADVIDTVLAGDIPATLLNPEALNP